MQSGHSTETADAGKRRLVYPGRHLGPRVIAIALLDAYRRWISPLLPAACRFTPTCSEYARLAFEQYGFWTASWLALKRLARCHPFHPGGVDYP